MYSSKQCICEPWCLTAVRAAEHYTGTETHKNLHVSQKNQCLLQNCSKSFNWHFTQVSHLNGMLRPILMVCWGHLVHKYTDEPITSSFRLCINMPSWHCLQKKKATSKILTCLLLTASSSSSFKDSERIRDTILSLRMAKSIFLTTFSKARQSESLTNKMWSTQAPKDSSPQVISQ